MKHWLATMIFAALDELDFRGRPARPGGGALPRKWVDVDNVMVSVVPHGDVFDLYVGQNAVVNIALSRQVMVRFAWWILTWWALRTWFGFKYVLWNWAISKLLDKKSQTRSRKEPRGLKKLAR